MKKMKLMKDIVLTEDQKERYTKELESDKWLEYFNKRTAIFYNKGW